MHRTVRGALPTLGEHDRGTGPDSAEVELIPSRVFVANDWAFEEVNAVVPVHSLQRDSLEDIVCVSPGVVLTGVVSTIVAGAGLMTAVRVGLSTTVLLPEIPVALSSATVPLLSFAPAIGTQQITTRNANSMAIR